MGKLSDGSAMVVLRRYAIGRRAARVGEHRQGVQYSVCYVEAALVAAAHVEQIVSAVTTRVAPYFHEQFEREVETMKIISQEAVQNLKGKPVQDHTEKQIIDVLVL